MATRNDLMNTQTGGEGETIQIQTQEQITPEQFDVDIKTQETPIDSEQQITTTENETGEPINPPVQRVMTEQEVVGAKPSEFYEAQASFNEEPPVLPEEQQILPPSIIAENDPEYFPYQPEITLNEENDPEYFPYIPDNEPKIGSFDTTLTNISEEPLDPELDNILKFQKRNGLIEEPGHEADHSIDFVGKEIDKNSFFSPPKDDFELKTTSGLDVNPESLKKAGIDYDPSTATLTYDERKGIEENIEKTAKEDEKQNILTQYYNVVEEIQSAQDALNQAKQDKRKEDISAIRKQLNTLDKQLTSLSNNEYVKEDIKSSKKEGKYAHKKAIKGLSKDLCRDKSSPNYGSPKPCLPPAPTSETDYTYYPDRWLVKDPFDYRTNTIAKNVFKDRLQFDGDKQVSGRYGDKISDSREAINAVLQLFANEGDIERISAQEGLSREQAAAKYTQSIISQYNMKPSELMAIDNLLRSSVNWARSEDGKQGNKFKAALLPNWGILPPVTVTLDNGKRITLFKDIQENEDQKKRNKNGYGISPWNKDSLQYKTYDINVYDTDPYYIPPKTLSYWEKYGMTTFDDNGNAVRSPGKFTRKTFNLQKRLLRALDENGEPYLKGDDPFFGVGLTGVMDDATVDAQNRFLSDEAKKSRKDTRLMTELTGTIFADGKEYTIGKDNPFYQFAQTGKVPNISYGGVKFKDTPFNTFKTREEVEKWANKNLSNNIKPITNLTTDTLNKSQEDFKDYIEGLGLGVSVKLLGGTLFTGGDKDLYERATIFDMDRVLLKPPAGIVAGSLEIDLGESDEGNKDRVAKLKTWLNSIQETPAQKYIDDWMSYNDPVNAVLKLGNKVISRGAEAMINSTDDKGNPITVTYGQGFNGESLYAQRSGTKVLNASEFTDFLQNKQTEIGSKIEALNQKSKQYNDAVSPDLQRLETLKKDTKEQQKKLAAELDLLEDDNKKGLIKDDAYYTKRATDLSNKIIALQTNLNNAITNANKSIQENKGLYDNIIKTEAEVNTAMAQLKGIGSDIEKTYALALEDAKATYKGPNTVFGSLMSSVVSGGTKAFTSIVDVMIDVEKAIGLVSETKEETAERKMELYEEWPNIMLGAFDLGKTEAYSKEEGKVMQALGGAAESITAMAVNPITRLTKGTPLQKAGEMVGFGSVAYADINKELYSNPKLKDLPEYQKKIIALPYAICMGFIEELGYGAIMKGNTSSFLGNALTPILNKALSKIPKNSSLEVIDKVIKSEVFANIGAISEAAAKGFAREAETELASTLGLEIGWKELSDAWLGLDAFNTGSTWQDYLKMATEAYVMGGIAGGALSSTFTAVQAFSNGDISTMTAKDLDAFRLTASNEVLKKQYMAYVANRQLTNDISKEQAESQILNFDKFIELNDKISDQIEGDDRLKMVDLLMKKQTIEERAKKLDKTQAGLPNPELDNVNKEIEGIVNKTAETINKQQENVKENQSRVSSEVGEGEKPIEAKPIVETSEEKVGPGGMVQEEQGEVEVTETEPQKITSVMTTGETQLESDLIGKDVSTGKQLKTADIQTGEVTSEFREDKNPTKGKVVNVEADPKNKNIERLILEDGTVLNRNKNTGSISLNNKVKATAPVTEVKGEVTTTNEFDELAEINKMTSPKKKKDAMKAFNEKYGEKSTRISEIDSKFTSIVNKLETKGIITKKNC